MKALVLDCETTGFDPEKEKVVEVAGAVVELGKKPRVASVFDFLVDPGIPIPHSAMAIHHILDKDVKGKPSLDQVLAEQLEDMEPYIPVAHNAGFDSQFLPVKKVSEWVCTWRCAKHFWPDLDSHSNQALRYSLGLFKEPEKKAMPPHRAAADVWVTSHILMRMLKDRTLEDLVELTQKPILLRKIHFGKHRGELWADAPKDYLRWILRSDFDADTMHTARHYLA